MAVQSYFMALHFHLVQGFACTISQETTTEGEGKACEYWLTFKDNILKGQHAGVQAGLTMDHCERKGNLWLSSDAKQNT